MRVIYIGDGSEYEGDIFELEVEFFRMLFSVFEDIVFWNLEYDESWDFMYRSFRGMFLGFFFF